MTNLTVLPPYPQDLFVGLALFDRAGLKAILALWRASLLAGFMGALASQLWFVALGLTDAARVRTLALVEVLFAQTASLKLFRERPSAREWLGMALIVAAAATLIGGVKRRASKGAEGFFVNFCRPFGECREGFAINRPARLLDTHSAIVDEKAQSIARRNSQPCAHCARQHGSAFGGELGMTGLGRGKLRCMLGGAERERCGPSPLPERQAPFKGVDSRDKPGHDE